jgi:hypothetical protein
MTQKLIEALTNAAIARSKFHNEILNSECVELKKALEDAVYAFYSTGLEGLTKTPFIVDSAINEALDKTLFLLSLMKEKGIFDQKCEMALADLACARSNG